MHKQSIVLAKTFLLLSLTHGVLLQAEEPSGVSVEVKSGGFSSAAVGSLGAKSNELSVHTLTHFVNESRVGIFFSGVNQPKGKQRTAYAVLVKHDLKDLEESFDFPTHQLNNGQKIRVTQAIKFAELRFRIKYTAHWSSADELREQLYYGDQKFDLTAGRLFLIDLTLPEPKLQQFSPDFGDELAFSTPASQQAREDFVARILTDARKNKAVKAFLEIEK